MYELENVYEDNIKRRLLILNINKYDYDIYIDKLLVTNSIIIIPSDSDSTQIIEYDLENLIIFHKVISKINYDTFSEFFNKMKDEAKRIIDSIEFLLNNYKILDYILIKDKLKNEEILDLFLLKIDFPKLILLKQCNKEKHFEFIFNCSLYYILYFLKDMIDNPKVVKSKCDYLNNIKIKIKNDENLTNK